jgi:hypothetical protein
MKYRELLDLLNKFNAEQLNCDVTIEDLDGDFLPGNLAFNDASIDDRLDDGHPVITSLDW